MKRKVKIFGERNTGTNYVEQLLRRNYPVRLLKDRRPMHFLESPVQLWNYKVGSYLRLKDSVPNCMIVKYEDIIADVGSFFDSTDRFLGLNGTRNNFPESATMGEKEMTYDMYARKYGSFDPATLGRKVLKTINRFLDRDVVEKAG